MTVLVMAAILAVGAQSLFAADKVAAKPAVEPGAIMVETVKSTAKVTAIDAAKRKVTFEADGKSRTITCGPEVRNFNQIKLGDRLQITFVEALAVYLEKAGAPVGADEVSTVTMAPEGGKPGIFVTDTIVLNSKIDALDATKGTVTITTPDGKTRTMKVSKSVKGLKGLKKGDDIVVRFTEELAMVIESPKECNQCPHAK